jgi:hypothetical protein
MSSNAVRSTVGIITANKHWVRFEKTRQRFSPLLLWWLSKAYAWSATVLVDELNASFLKGALYNLKGRSTRFARSGF